MRWSPEVVAEILRAGPEGMTAAEFSAFTGLSSARAYRVLDRAERAGLVRALGRPAHYTARIDTTDGATP